MDLLSRQGTLDPSGATAIPALGSCTQESNHVQRGMHRPMIPDLAASALEDDRTTGRPDRERATWNSI